MALDRYHYLPLIGETGKAVDGEWLTIIQHPGGEAKQVCVRENKLLTRTEDALWYSTDTLGGSSGSPVFNNSWQVVALHHKGIPEKKHGVIQRVEGGNFDPARDSETSIKWIANEGIRVSRLVDDVRRQAASAPLLEPVLAMTVERARALIEAFSAERSPAGGPTSPPIVPATARSVTMRSLSITLDIADDGSVSLRDPGGATESFTIAEAARPASAKVPKPSRIDVDFDPDYGPSGKRKGYDPAWAGQGFRDPAPRAWLIGGGSDAADRDQGRISVGLSRL